MDTLDLSKDANLYFSLKRHGSNKGVNCRGWKQGQYRGDLDAHQSS